jgi:SAM-dependent methyltransferase
MSAQRHQVNEKFLADWQRDNERNARYFSECLIKYGISARALDWSGEHSQFLRFRVLTEVGALSGARVLDVGCGLGDLCGWLRANSHDVRYTGIDIAPAMIEAARGRFPDARFEVRDVLSDPVQDSFDYVLSSGIFTHRTAEAKLFFEAMIEQMFALTQKGLAVNCLSRWAEKIEPEEFHADPLEAVAFCRKMTPRVVLRHDYHPGDFTLYLYKKAAAG